MIDFRRTLALPLTASALALLLAACGSAPLQPTAPSAAPAQTPPSARVVPPAQAERPGKGGYYKDDGPGTDIPPDLASIPDAIPREEPIRAANSRPYEALGQTFTPMRALAPFSQTGIGSWYGKKFHGARTATGERYDMYAMSAAHPTLPLPSYALVTNLENDKSVVVRVNDRGPFLHSRIIDLSYAAANKLGYIGKGSARLRVELIQPAEYASYANRAQQMAQERAPAPPAPAASAPVASPVLASAELPPAAAPSQSAGDSDFRVSPVSEAPPPAGIFLQLGAFSSPGNATGFRDYVQGQLKWLRQGVQAYLVEGKYRLRVGPFASSKEARDVAERISAALKIKPFLIE